MTLFPGRPAGRTRGQRREAVAVLAEERGPIDDRRAGRVVDRAADDRSGLAPRIEERPRPSRRHDDVILDDRHGIRASPGRTRSRAFAGWSCRAARGCAEPGGSVARAPTVRRHPVDRRRGPRPGRRVCASSAVRQSDQVAERVDGRYDDRQLSGHRRRRGLERDRECIRPLRRWTMPSRRRASPAAPSGTRPSGSARRHAPRARG